MLPYSLTAALPPVLGHHPIPQFIFIFFHILSLQTDVVCLAGYVCCRQENSQSIGENQVTDIVELSHQLAGEDTVRITRQPVQVTHS